MNRRPFRATNEVLLIADDQDTLWIYATGLEYMGFTVFSTASRINADAFLRGGRPPNILIVVASLRNPGAWAELDPLLRSAARAQVPAVIVTPTVRPDGRHRRAALARGCAAFVGQPCSPFDLSKIVRRVLAGDVPIVLPPLPSADRAAR